MIVRVSLVVAPLAALLVGCASTNGSNEDDVSSTSSEMTTNEIMKRADDYIAANVPYCGGERGGKDYICGGTCSRPAAPWDDYRSDCSGFVSWVWQIASDPTTSEFIDDRSGANGWFSIGIDDLKAGDAVVCDGHIKLFSKFVSKTAAEIYEEYDCGEVGRKAVQNFKRSGDTVQFSGDTRVYHAIRRNGLTVPPPPDAGVPSTPSTPEPDAGTPSATLTATPSVGPEDGMSALGEDSDATGGCNTSAPTRTGASGFLGLGLLWVITRRRSVSCA